MATALGREELRDGDYLEVRASRSVFYRILIGLGGTVSFLSLERRHLTCQR